MSRKLRFLDKLGHISQCIVAFVTNGPPTLLLSYEETNLEIE